MTRRELLMMMMAAAVNSGADPAKRLYPIGLGTWQTFDVTSPTPALEEVLRLFVQLGGSVVDSSPMYGRSESVLGDLAVKLAVRDKLYVATKVWTTGRGASIAQMEDSERKLRGKVDLMQVHNLQDAETHLETLRRWKAEGRVKHIGVTHYHAAAHDRVAEYVRRAASTSSRSTTRSPSARPSGVCCRWRRSAACGC